MTKNVKALVTCKHTWSFMFEWELQYALAKGDSTVWYIQYSLVYWSLSDLIARNRQRSPFVGFESTIFLSQTSLTSPHHFRSPSVHVRLGMTLSQSTECLWVVLFCDSQQLPCLSCFSLQSFVRDKQIRILIPTCFHCLWPLWFQHVAILQNLTELITENILMLHTAIWAHGTFIFSFLLRFDTVPRLAATIWVVLVAIPCESERWD